MRVPSLVVRVVCGLAVVLGSAGERAHAATFTTVGDLPGGPFHSEARKVSADGVVVIGNSVGSSGTTHPGTSEAFRWTAAGGLQGLGDFQDNCGSTARGVSADGSVIAGESCNALDPIGWEPFRWTEAGGLTSLGCLPGGVLDCRARAVSADGSVVVGRSDSTQGTQAFVWTQAGGMQGLGDLAGGGFDSRAIGISADASVIVGRGESASGIEAYRWTAADGMQGLGDLPGGAFMSVAEGVSADGQVVVGFSESSQGIEAFRWTAAGGMQGLGDLPGGAFESQAFFTSADGGVVVGFSESDAGLEAFFWDVHNGMQNLHDALEREFGVDLSGFSLTAAWGVSADGLTLVGTSRNAANDKEGYVAVLDVGCSDGLDNDGDGETDWPDDPGCAAADDLLEASPLFVCDDGLDNDGDGRVDFALDPEIGDPACRWPTFPRESAQCQDGIDNDGQTGTDFDGGESILGPGNGDPEGPDPQCAGTAWRDREKGGGRCGLGFELALVLLLVTGLPRRRT